MLSFKSARPRQIGNCLLADVGVNACNKQHLRLASYAVEFHEMVESLAEKEPDKQDWRQIDALFSRITRFVAVHFREEEDLMVKHGYPDYARHRTLHEKFIKDLANVQSQINNRNIRFKGKLSTMLWNWLFNHINVEDYKYREFFLEKGVK